MTTKTALTLGQAYNKQLSGTWPTSWYIAPNNKLWAWGRNLEGQLGLDDKINRSSPVQLGTLTDWLSISAGYDQSSAIKTNGTLWTWGNNAYGNLGLGNTTGYSSPKQVGSLTNWSKVYSAYTKFNVAVKTDGTLWSWGGNFKGQLGLGNDGLGTYKSSPTQVGVLTDWLSITASYSSVLAVKTNGTLWAWGDNTSGKLGLGDISLRNSPVQVGLLTNWKIATIGPGHSVAVKTNGTLWTWGKNSYGQLGDNTTVIKSSPVQVGLLTNWAYAVVGTSHTIAIKTDGTLWAVGRSDFSGALGLGDNVNKSSPVQVGALTTWLSIAAGSYSSFALRTDGTLWSWGFQQQSSLGLNNATNYSSPKQIGSATTWKSISATVQYALAISS